MERMCRTFTVGVKNPNDIPYMLLFGAHLKYKAMKIMLLLYFLGAVCGNHIWSVLQYG